MMKCPYCGHENTDDATKCERCFAGFHKDEKINSENTKENSGNGENTKRNRKRSE